MTLVGVAQTGDRRATLETLRDMLAEQLEQCGQQRDFAALTLRLTDVLEQLDNLPANTTVSAADEIADRRAARRSARAKSAARAKRPS